METEDIMTEEAIAAFCSKLHAYAVEHSDLIDAGETIPMIGIEQLLSWNLLREKDGNYYPTQEYLLLAGQTEDFPDATIQCAAFMETRHGTASGWGKMDGPIYQQVDEACSFVMRRIRDGFWIGETGGYQDMIPVNTIREMIAIAVCNRCYQTRESIQVVINDERLEVTFPGGSDGKGIFQIRNKGIAAVFSYMHVMRSLRGGRIEMYSEAERYGFREPQFTENAGDICVILQSNIGSRSRLSRKPATQKKIEIRKSMLLNLISENPGINQAELAKRMHISHPTVQRLMADMQRCGEIRMVGSKAKSRWIVVENQGEEVTVTRDSMSPENTIGSIREQVLAKARNLNDYDLNLVLSLIRRLES